MPCNIRFFQKWLGSGSVLKNSDGEYVMNFSEECASSF